MELREPRRKRRLRGRQRPTAQPSFPIPTESRTGIPASYTVWHVSIGKYNGDCVIIENREDMCRLNSQGYFGKGSLSRNFPEFDQVTHGIPPFIRERQWSLRNKWAKMKVAQVGSENIEINNDARMPSPMTVDGSNLLNQPIESLDLSKCLESENNAELNVDNLSNAALAQTRKKDDCEVDNQTSLEISQGRDVVVLNDSDSECEEGTGTYILNLKSRIENEPCSVYETLHFTLEEAFFLSYALGCLKVVDLFGNELSLTSMWQLFVESQEDFIQMYVVYHYFRAKGWIVKPGLKFGGDFVLYKQGPSFYHSSYIVKVEVIKEKVQCYDKNSCNSLRGWTRVMGLNRLAETANKELLLCQVVWPSDLPENALQNPTVLSRFSVHELLVRRWVASQERHIDDEEL